VLHIYIYIYIYDISSLRVKSLTAAKKNGMIRTRTTEITVLKNVLQPTTRLQNHVSTIRNYKQCVLKRPLSSTIQVGGLKSSRPNNEKTNV